MTTPEVEACVRIVGRSNANRTMLGRMVKALRLHPWNNTPEEDARLQAAKFLLRWLGARKLWAVP